MEATTYKLKVRVGDAEFDAEGPEETVRSQFDSFLAVLSAAPPSQRLAPPKADPLPPPPAVAGDEPVSPHAQELLRRAYSDANGEVSLRVLPRTETAKADALLLILYGYRVLRGDPDVLASDLIGAARQSGIQVNRVDRVLPGHLVNKGGSKSGSRYGLNNPGISHAQQVLEGMFD